MVFKEQVKYILVCLFCLYPALVYGEGLGVSKEVPVIADIEQKVQDIVLSDHEKAVQYARGGDLISAYSHIQKLIANILMIPKYSLIMC